MSKLSCWISLYLPRQSALTRSPTYRATFSTLIISQRCLLTRTASLIPIADTSKEAMQLVNVGGTKNLLAAAKTYGVTSFVYTSSATVGRLLCNDLSNLFLIAVMMRAFIVKQPF